MNADMAFECLLVSRDPGVISVVNKLLEGLSVSTDVCFTTSKAVDRLTLANTDLVIVDWDDTSLDLLRRVQQVQGRQKPTVVVVSTDASPVPGAHFTLHKPLTGETCSQSLRWAYQRMLRNHRRHARYALMVAVTANSSNRAIPMTVMDIGDGGVGLMTRELLAVGEVLSFRLRLPGTERPISVEARVHWARQYGAVGCEFVRIPPVDLGIFHDWLKAKCRVKKPAVNI